MRFFAILLFVFAFPVGAFGQIIPTLTPPTEIQLVPEFPAPNADVLVTAQNLLNKDALTYIWTVNGEVVDQGIGRDSVVISVGEIGEETTVSVTASDGGEIVGQSSRTVVPAEIDLVWEGNTYTPPFYLGRPLPTAESTITIAAIPNIRVNGVRLSEQTLTYEWYLNNNASPFRTGYGLSSIEVEPPVFNSSFTISVIAKTQSGATAAEGLVTITPQEPEIVFYEESPLLGLLFNNAVTNQLTLFGDEVTLRLFPLFVTDPDDSVYRWELSGEEVNTGDTPRELTLRKTGAGSGNFRLEVSLETPGTLFEEAVRNLRLTF